MFYTVSEAAELTKLSKVSIYNKIKLKELQPYVIKKQGVTYITEEGIKIINDGLNTFSDSLNGDGEGSSNNAENVDNKENAEIKNDFINYLKSENERLWQQVNHLSRLVENGQVLLKDKAQADTSLLEAHCEEFDTKLDEAKERMAERKNDAKSLFGKWFGSK